HRALSDAYAGHDDAAFDGRTVVDHDVGTEHRVTDGRGREDTAGTDDRFLREAALHELGGREVLGRSADRPAPVVEVEDRVHGHQIHVGVVERIEGSDIAPVRPIAFGGSRHDVVVEVVDVRHA